MVAAGSVAITPRRPCPLAGFEGRDAPYSSIADPLEMAAVLLRQGRVSALLLSADVLFVGNRLEAAVRRPLERAGLSDCLVLAAASHTHFAPASDDGTPALGRTDERFCEEYLASAVSLVERLLQDAPVAARLRYGSAPAPFSVNRRRRGWWLDGVSPRRAVAMRADPRGPTDPSVRLLRIDDLDGRARAVVWSYACHPVAYPRSLAVTAEFPGVVRDALRRRDGSALPVLFLQGFSGNVRPPAILGPGRSPARRLDHLLHGPSLGSFSGPAYRRWTESLAAVVSELSSSQALRELAPQLGHERRAIPLSAVIDGAVGDRELAILRLALSDDVQVVAVTAEVVVEYVEHLRRLFPDVESIPVGCVGPVFGYLPTDRMVAEGGYEAGGFFGPFGLSGSFRQSVETPVLALLRELEPAARD